MKPFLTIQRSVRILRVMAFSTASWLPLTASGVDWTAAGGAFGTGANWAGGSVPSAATANISNGGTASITTGNSFSVTTLWLGNFSGSGSVIQDGGAITATNQVMIGGTNTNGGTGVGTYAMSGGSLSSTSGNEFWIGTRGGTGTMSLSGNAQVTAGGTSNIGRDGGGTGSLMISGNAEFKTTSSDINVGVVTGNSNSLITVQNSGKLTSGREIAVGLFGNSSTCGNLLVKDSATVSTVGSIVVGKQGAKGMLTVSGNSIVNPGTYLIVGSDTTASDGTVTLNGNATVNPAGQVWLGNSSSKGEVIVNGGTLMAHAYNGNDAGAGISFRGTSKMTLNGGVVETPGFNKTGGTATVIFNGGVIKATGVPLAGSFFNHFAAGEISIQAGGAGFDTNGSNLSIVQGMTGAGGLTKSGGGKLVLGGSNVYQGLTRVLAGSLGGTGGLTGGLEVAAGAAIAPGVSTGVFTAGATTVSGTYSCDIDETACDKLVVNGALEVSAATLAFNVITPPSGAVLVIASYTGAVPAPFASVTGLPGGYELDYGYQGNQIALVRPGGSSFEVWMAGYYPGETDPAVVAPGADPDRDGYANGLEFALGGSPRDGASGAAVYLVKSGEPGGTPPVSITAAVRAGTPAFTDGPSPAARKEGFFYTVRGTRDLVNFNEVVTPVATITTGLPPVPAGYEYRTFQLEHAAGKTKGFLRVEVVPYGEDNLPVGNFDGASYAPWTVTGTVFNPGPANGALITQLEIQNADGGVASSEIQGDGPVGTLMSTDFRIERRYISFSIAGGDYERHACLNLLVGGKVVKSATGRFSDVLAKASWDVQDYLGQTARIQIVDEAQGSWGHVNVGRIAQTDTPQVMPVDKGTLYGESLRPLTHFTARQFVMDRLNPGMRQEGWLNDLNGMIYYEGEYHMFAQRWNKCWIHAVSTDLVHWTELEPAFWEERLDSAVQSGSCVIDYQNTSGLSSNPATPPMVAFWSRNSPEHCISYSLDKGRTWTHHTGNPILTFPERDPKVFWYAPGNHWVMMLYGNGQYHIFTSPNLLNWTNQNHPVADAFECPDFFELPVVGNAAVKRWVLVHADGRYSTGAFNGTQFTEETPRVYMDHGGLNFYATQSFENTGTGDGRRIQMAWIRGSDFPNMPFSQQVSFPCELTLHQTPAGLRVFRQPVSETALLHEPGQTWSNLNLAANQQVSLAASGEAYRIKAQVSIPAGSSLVFTLRGFPVTLTSNGMDGGTGSRPVQGQVTSVELLVDRASVESFANAGEVSCTRFFQPGQNGFSVKATGGGATISSMEVYPLKSMWEGQIGE